MTGDQQNIERIEEQAETFETYANAIHKFFLRRSGNRGSEKRESKRLECLLDVCSAPCIPRPPSVKSYGKQPRIH